MSRYRLRGLCGFSSGMSWFLWAASILAVRFLFFFISILTVNSSLVDSAAETEMAYEDTCFLNT